MSLEVEFQKGGKVKVGEMAFDSVEAYADSGFANPDMLGALRTANAAAIAEQKALVGSSAHHMERGAGAHMHYDQYNERGSDEAQAWAGAVPVARATGLPESAFQVTAEDFFQAPAPEAGNAATAGTGEESVQAQIEASDSQRVYEEVVFGPSPTKPSESSADQANVAPGGEDTGTGPYEGRKMAQLRAVARKQGVSARGSKADVIARLRGEDEGDASPASDAPTGDAPAGDAPDGDSTATSPFPVTGEDA